MDAEQLREHLTYTPDYVQRHRSLIAPGSCGGDVLSYGGFCAIENADREVAAVVNLFLYVHTQGTIQLSPAELHRLLMPFWFIGRNGLDIGRCKGMRDADSADTLRTLEDLCWWTLRPVAGEIVTTEGVGPYLAELEKIRAFSLKRFPEETDKWLTEGQAQKLTGKGERQLERWRRPDEDGETAVQFQEDEWGILYSKRSLEFRMELVKKEQTERAEKARKARECAINAGHSNLSDRMIS